MLPKSGTRCPERTVVPSNRRRPIGDGSKVEWSRSTTLPRRGRPTNLPPLEALLATPARLSIAFRIEDNARPDCKSILMATPVARDQFVMTAEGITHVPTGVAFAPRPGSPLSGNLHVGQLGNRLKNGDDHRPDEVDA